MSGDDHKTDKNCGIGFSSGIRRHVTKPKLFDEAMHVRLPGGTKARIDALRGGLRQGDFVRQVLLDGLERLEAASSKAEKAKKKEEKRQKRLQQEAGQSACQSVPLPCLLYLCRGGEANPGID